MSTVAKFPAKVKNCEKLSKAKPRPTEADQAALVAQEQHRHMESVLNQLGALEVQTVEDYELAGGQLRDIQARKKEIEEKKDGILRPLIQAERRVRALFKPPLDLCSEARKLIEDKMTVWRREQERKRRKEEERLQALARKEQEKLQRRAERKAEKLREKGNEEAAQETLESIPDIAVPVLAEPNIPKSVGIKTRDIWKFRIRNLKQQTELLGKVIARYNANKNDDEPELIPAEWWTIDEKSLGQFVRSTKGKVKVAGIEVYSDEITAVEAT